MELLKKIVTMTSIALALIAGYPLIVATFLCVGVVVAVYLVFIISLHFEGPIFIAITFDIVTLAVLILIIRSRRVRAGAMNFWKQVWKNL